MRLYKCKARSSVSHTHLKVREEEEELKRMGSKSSWSMVAVAIMALSVVAMLDGCMAQSFCNTSLPELFKCKPAVTPPNPSPPTPECCAVVSKADLKCLCGLKNSPLVPTLGIDLNLAFQLPAKCNLSLPPQC
ncbi:putative lipid-transfer protein DIR1 [Arachis stenosperma]|uniref:putative lipid-transfer protein DIR1 n=1 Tax=Arachis stenosperma TaxID=217475 RepID=UPI0025AB9966|nr:putative lipid-transfer protein DIR1 [Arachis stenosperma]